MPQTRIYCIKCGREHATCDEASHCEQTDLVIQGSADQMFRNLRHEDVRQIVHSVIVALSKAGYINPAVSPDQVPTTPKEPAHGHPEPGS